MVCINQLSSNYSIRHASTNSSKMIMKHCTKQIKIILITAKKQPIWNRCWMSADLIIKILQRKLKHSKLNCSARREQQIKCDTNLNMESLQMELVQLLITNTQDKVVLQLLDLFKARLNWQVISKNCYQWLKTTNLSGEIMH